MVRQIARGLAGLNAAYQGAIGLLSMVSPSAAGRVYQLPPLSPTSSALIRILGGMMVGNALVLSAFTRDPEANPALASLLLAGCGANVAADAIACRSGEIRWRQVAGSPVFQSGLAVALGLSMFQVRSCRAEPIETPSSGALTPPVPSNP